MTDKYLIYYGANEKKIYRYPFTSLKNSDLIMKTLNNSEKQILKKKLKIAEEKNNIRRRSVYPKKRMEHSNGGIIKFIKKKWDIYYWWKSDRGIYTFKEKK